MSNLKFNPFSRTFQYITDSSLLKLKGVVNTAADLPLSDNEENDCYIVKSNDHIFTWNKTTPTGLLSDWVDVGAISSVDWSAITNKPLSIADDIDDAVTKRHSHVNQAQLDLVTDGDHDVRIDNPHNVTKSQVGLNNVPNLDTTNAVNKAHDQNTDSGTTGQTFSIDSDAGTPLKLKNTSGSLEIRNNDDNAYLDIKAKDIVVSGELSDGTNKADVTTVLLNTINFLIDGGGSVISTDIKGDILIPFDCTIVEASLLADLSGSITLDIWKDTYANFPPTSADTITASAKPALSSALKSQDSTLTGWTKDINAGEILRINVDSAATITRVLLCLKVRKK